MSDNDNDQPDLIRNYYQEPGKHLQAFSNKHVIGVKGMNCAEALWREIYSGNNLVIFNWDEFQVLNLVSVQGSSTFFPW